MSRQSINPDEDSALNPKLSASAFDFLLIELVPMAYRLHADLLAREEELVTQASLLHLYPSRKNKRQRGDPNDPTTTTTTDAKGASAQVVDVGSTTAAGTNKPGDGAGDLAAGEEDEATREAVFHRLDKLGYRVGQGLVERFAADLPRPSTHLDAIKFICKDLWTRVFRKQIDNLKTNHRGTFVLTDGRFQPLARMSVDRSLGPRGVDVALQRAQGFLWFPCGIIRGALSGLGITASVNAETADLPGATFQIRVAGAKP